MITPQEIADDILSRGDLIFIDVVKFYNRRDYEMASNLHTDTLAMGDEILDVDELNEIEEPIREYSIRDLSRAERLTEARLEYLTPTPEFHRAFFCTPIHQQRRMLELHFDNLAQSQTR